MAKKIRNFFKKLFSQRTMILLAVFVVMTVILVGRLFDLQIVNGEEYAQNFTISTTRERALKSTRGNIYDVNGKLLAYNELSNSVTLEDSGTYETTRERNLSLNGEIYRLIQLIEKNGDSINTSSFHIIVDESGNFAFDLSEGTSLNRFRADVYGEALIDDLEEDELNASADTIMEYLSGSSRFALYNEDNPYTAEELSEHGLPAEISREEQLKIVIVRYQLSLTSYQRYMQVTVASDVSDETVAAIMENIDSLPGVDIAEDSIRVYNDAEALSSIIGYTGSPSQEELEELQQVRDDYSSTSIIGKTGIEQYMETTLQGTDGSEQVIVDNLGRVQAVNEDATVEPIQGNDVYLTIDSELQVACYQILEQRIAGILVSNIQNIKAVDDTADTESDAIPIPIYDVYYALIENSVIDISHFSAADATSLEQQVYQKFLQKQESVLSWLNSELNGENPEAYAALSDEEKEYVDYIVDEMLTTDTGILNTDVIDTADSVYQAWTTDESISLREYLSYAASQNWLDISQLSDESTYLNSDEVYQLLVSYIQSYLTEDTGFSKLLYKYMLQNDQLYPEEVCGLLYDQNILSKDDAAYQSFQAGTLSPYDLMIQKIQSLEITPAQLALDPCSGSMVVVDPDSGEVRALVTYPGYDNNRLANQMDTAYYNQLYNDLSTPFYNKATQQLTAPGSTFKPVMVAAGLNEGVIDENTIINCDGLFGEGLVSSTDQLRCWYSPGHGDLNVVSGLANSCNEFFCTIGYRLGLNAEGEFVQDDAISKIQMYASMFGLDQDTNLQISESSPHVSDELPIPSSIGQGTHLYTTAQLARYAATIQTRGTSYDLNLLDKVTDSSGNVIEEYSPQIANQSQFSDAIWDDIHEGMRGVIQNNATFSDLPVELYGKTGTAEESRNRPNHALFIGFSHYGEEQEDIAFAVRIAYGYSSGNAAVAAKDMLSYYYNLEDETEVLTGTADSEGLTTAVTD